jgi:hypothetical protein
MLNTCQAINCDIHYIGKFIKMRLTTPSHRSWKAALNVGVEKSCATNPCGINQLEVSRFAKFCILDHNFCIIIQNLKKFIGDENLLNFSSFLCPNHAQRRQGSAPNLAQNIRSM